MRGRLMVLLALAFCGAAAQAGAQPCLIFVHGKQTDTNTYTSYSAARSYWVNGSRDFVRTATKGFAASWYVVGYNGTRPYWESQSAGEVANEILNATNGGADGGGNRCALTYAQGGTFWVVAHSMGGALMDFILGNDDPSDPNYNGPYDQVAQRVSLVITTGGAHRGSQGADAVCGDSGLLCNFLAIFIQDCDDATYWLRSADDVQVKTYANAPAKTVWLTGGYEAIFGASACLSGEDDGVVQYASIFACSGSATASYSNSNVCTAKQESAGPDGAAPTLAVWAGQVSFTSPAPVDLFAELEGPGRPRATAVTAEVRDAAGSLVAQLAYRDDGQGPDRGVPHLLGGDGLEQVAHLAQQLADLPDAELT